MRIKLAISAIALFSSFLCYSQNTYYLSPTGSDANNGLTPGTAWLTLAKINSLDLDPGDKVLLEGGATFTGSLQLDQYDNGTSVSPITISSYGTGRATIFAPGAFGFYASNADEINLTNLIFRG